MNKEPRAFLDSMSGGANRKERFHLAMARMAGRMTGYCSLTNAVSLLAHDGNILDEKFRKAH